MTDERPANEPGGVFGNLPGARPGTRSPRRDAAARASRPGPSEQPRDPPPTAASERPPEHEPQSAEPEAADPEDRGSGIEDVAWAGIAVAAEAATLGVRLASRAIDAVRGNPERR